MLSYKLHSGSPYFSLIAQYVLCFNDESKKNTHFREDTLRGGGGPKAKKHFFFIKGTNVRKNMNQGLGGWVPRP